MSMYDEQFTNDERANRKKENYYDKKRPASRKTTVVNKKITVVLYKNEIHLMGAPKGFEVVVLNLDKGILINDDESDTDE